MRIFVYQVSDHEYGAGFVKSACERLGKIVETWPVNTKSEAIFLASHGTNYGKASSRVSDLADVATRLILKNGHLYETAENPVIVTQEEWSLLVEEKEKKLEAKAEVKLKLMRQQREVERRQAEDERKNVIEWVGKERDEAMVAARTDFEQQIQDQKQIVIDELTGLPLLKRVSAAIKLIFKRI